jgi:uncharacterized membrane protein (UPF0127 family)
MSTDVAYTTGVATAPFLAGARAGAGAPALVNERTARTVAETVEVASTSASRRRGLLGRDSLDAGTALVIAPCSAIHTFFMRFAIDVVFVDRRGHVLKIVHDLRPWRIAGSLRAYAVIEMAGGRLGQDDIRIGDRLTLRSGGLATMTSRETAGEAGMGGINANFD